MEYGFEYTLQGRSELRNIGFGAVWTAGLAVQL